MSLPDISRADPPTSPTRQQNKLLNIFTIIGLSILLITLAVSSIPPGGADKPECRAIYMYPSYAKIIGFDETHTKFASKYGLYLYREQGKDKTPGENGNYDILDGIPVLFIPGNAGSYRQVRSIAAEAAMIFHYHRDNPEYAGKNFDFYAGDFNEDFTAFHGRTMLDQAEYLNDAIKFILSLYANKPTPPTSVIVIGHSMGGVVSRVMMTLPNYVEGSINTIITLAAPHAAAPATFDGDILKIYASADQFWRAGFSGKDEASTARFRFKDVSLVSITGGAEDSILPADYTTLTGLVPLSNGFTVYTTGIPGIWTPIDHLAIVWCDQLRKVVASVLYDIADPNVATKTLPLKERMGKFRRQLLTGFEDYAVQDFAAINEKKSIEVEITEANSIKVENSVINEASTGKLHLISLSGIEDPVFTLVTSCKPASEFKNDSEFLSVLLCSQKSDFKFECTDVSTDLYKIPNSSKGVKSLSDSSIGGEKTPFYAGQFSPSSLNTSTHIIVKAQTDLGVGDFTQFGVSSASSQKLRVNAGILHLLFGSTISFPTKSLLTKDIEYHNAWSSIVSFKLHVNSPAQDSKFQPFVRQWVEDPFETKWHLNLEESKHISIHGIAPYTPFKLNSNPLHIELFSDKDSQEAQISLRIDIFQSLRLLVLRYRLVLASFPIFVITLVLLIQFNVYFDSGIFPSFQMGLTLLAGKSTCMLVALSILCPLSSTSLLHSFFYVLDPVAYTAPQELGTTVHVNPYFLGLEEKYLFLLGPLFYLISLSLVHGLNFIINSLLRGVPLAISLHRKLLKASVSQNIGKIITVKRRKRTIASLLLLSLVLFYVPYQLGFIICVIVQIFATIIAHIDALESSKEKLDTKRKSTANYNTSLLILFIWIIPVNIPVLIVFFHNLTVRWKTPFTSHHNILAILPILLLVGKNLEGEITMSPKNPVQKKLTAAVLLYFAFFSLIYGIRHLYWLHFLLNFLSSWLFVLSFWE